MWPYGHRTCLQHSATMYERTGTTGASPMCNGDCLLPTGPYYSQTVANKFGCNMSTWCSQPPPNYTFVTETPASNSREMRNRAEKQRRDKLNTHISELAQLVPLVSSSAKKMDKTSILRLTATHLRLYTTILKRISPKNEFSMLDQITLLQLIYEQMAGFLLILTADGKIVYVSHTVEHLLGHLQTDLMGQSLYTIAAADDHVRLKAHLSTSKDTDWRRHFRLSLAKAGPRSEQTQYETFSVVGMVPTFNDSKKPREIATTSKVSSDILVFFVSLFRPMSPERLIDPTKDEYITRHLIDGRIINCDHRISLVAGYMIEEVSGKSAFNYMHKEDVRWTMVALRKMYDRGESQGWSCYRLLSRTGQFIYLRTCGYLELSNGVLESFVCINTLVDEKEGIRLIKEMKQRYSVMIDAVLPSEFGGAIGAVEDPAQLDECIKYLITNIPPSPKSESKYSPHYSPRYSPKPSSPHLENQDCYRTNNLPNQHAIEIKTTVKRSTSDEENSRKKHKKRSHSLESVGDICPQSSNIASTHNSTRYRSNMSDIMMSNYVMES